MTFEEAGDVLRDFFGKYRSLEAELAPRAVQGSLLIVSGQQYFRLGRFRFPLPNLFTGRATIKEWEEANGIMNISVTVHSPLIGDFFGYEGKFSKVV